MAIKRDSIWDLSVYNSEDRLVLVVEIKRKLNVSSEWAAQLRSNLLTRTPLPKNTYFLLIFPDKFYLWSNAGADRDYCQPTYTIDPSPILQPYLEKAGVTFDQISAASLELIIASWLGEIIYSQRASEDIDASQQWLVESGLYSALTGDRFEDEAAA